MGGGRYFFHRLHLTGINNRNKFLFYRTEQDERHCDEEDLKPQEEFHSYDDRMHLVYRLDVSWSDHLANGEAIHVL